MPKHSEGGRIGNSGIYWTAVKTSYFREFVARQEEDYWCWAACVQMVLNYQGVNVDQKDVARRAEELRINEGGTAYDIQRAADGWNTGNHVIAARVDNPRYVTAQTFITDLIDKYPLIIGLDMSGLWDMHTFSLEYLSGNLEAHINQSRSSYRIRGLHPL